MRTSHFLIPVGYEYFPVFLFLIAFGPVYHARTVILGHNRPNMYQTELHRITSFSTLTKNLAQKSLMRPAV